MSPPAQPLRPRRAPRPPWPPSTPVLRPNGSIPPSTGPPWGPRRRPPSHQPTGAALRRHSFVGCPPPPPRPPRRRRATLESAAAVDARPRKGRGRLPRPAITTRSVATTTLDQGPGTNLRHRWSPPPKPPPPPHLLLLRDRDLLLLRDQDLRDVVATAIAAVARTRASMPSPRASTTCSALCAA